MRIVSKNRYRGNGECLLARFLKLHLNLWHHTFWLGVLSVKKTFDFSGVDYFFCTVGRLSFTIFCDKRPIQPAGNNFSNKKPKHGLIDNDQ